jgi:hypothetical protein
VPSFCFVMSVLVLLSFFIADPDNMFSLRKISPWKAFFFEKFFRGIVEKEYYRKSFNLW